MTGDNGRRSPVDERIGAVYLFHNGLVAVFDLDGNQMSAYQDPSPEARAALKVAFPEHLWHAWQDANLCRCGRAYYEHNHPASAWVAARVGLTR